ncbi:CoA pyrophosphatase [Brachybacterium halotolerans subsp. kimchii]|uniref:NUDIX hydrolase n=1 Tax=Brachybacterium halotolerans TaxID=2795215 RepID=UPI001E469B8D|nr:CoA pyrophosphatase [Brachybacterium halotolerans]UEJ84130.1 CoA pyrophosphatase [Brachybacterium halotolerans subsp. kimchii]
MSRPDGARGTGAGADAPDRPELPGFLHPLAERARAGDHTLALPRSPGPARDITRRSAVLLLVSGASLEEAELVVEERGHRMRSQPGQFALPGGGVEPEDADVRATALREAREEIGLDAEQVHVLGEFAPIRMPWRGQVVHPVAAWAPRRPDLAVGDPVEVERVVRLPLVGPDSLTDPSCRFMGSFDGRAVGPVFSLSQDRFVWGFTAMLVEGALEIMGLAPDDAAREARAAAGRAADASDERSAVPAAPPRIEIPPERRREGPRA